LNQSFVQSLASPLALQFQARSIMELLNQAHVLDSHIQSLSSQRNQLSSVIRARQNVLRASVADPRIFLKTVFWNNPQFVASTEQLNRLVAVFGWNSDEVGVPQGHDYDVVRPGGVLLLYRRSPMSPRTIRLLAPWED
ncbi:hypothetical protein MPER_03774, partial [Moniliophthora perniciosa FA553]